MQFLKFYIQLEGRVLEPFVGAGVERSSLSADIVGNFYLKTLEPVSMDVLTTDRQECHILGALRLQTEICTAKYMCNFLVMQHFSCSCILGTNFFLILAGPVRNLLRRI